MLKAIFTVFISVLIIILGAFLAIGSKIYRAYKTMSRPWSSNKKGRNYKSQQTNNQTNEATPDKKVFGDDEGEYVDFEEIKGSNKEDI